MESNVFLTLQKKVELGKKNHKRIAKFFLDYRGDYRKLKVVEVAELTLTSNATIVRFCQDMGYMGFPEFKIDLATQSNMFLGTENTESINDLNTSEHFEAIVKSLKMTEDANDKIIINAIVDRIKNSEKIDIYAVGETNIVAQDFQLKLIRIGFNATAYSDAHTQHFTASHGTNRTVALGISYSGTSTSVFENLKTSKENGSTTFLVAKPGLKKPSYVDYMLCCSATESGSRVFSTTSRFAILFLLDIIYHELIATDTDRFNQLLDTTRIIKGR